jgi:hypothetical protein
MRVNAVQENHYLPCKIRASTRVSVRSVSAECVSHVLELGVDARQRASTCVVWMRLKLPAGCVNKQLCFIPACMTGEPNLTCHDSRQYSSSSNSGMFVCVAGSPVVSSEQAAADARRLFVVGATASDCSDRSSPTTGNDVISSTTVAVCEKERRIPSYVVKAEALASSSSSPSR